MGIFRDFLPQAILLWDLPLFKPRNHIFLKKKISKKMHKTLTITFTLSLMADHSYIHFTQPHVQQEHETSFLLYAHLQHGSSQLIFFSL